METIQFQLKECLQELPINLGEYNQIPDEFANGKIYRTDYFEIIFFAEAKGKLIVDQTDIDLSDNTVVFLSPYQKRQWFVKDNAVNARYVIFQEEFLNEFFADKLFVYRLQYFFQHQNPFYIHTDEKIFERLQVILSEIGVELKNFRCDSSHLVRSLLYFILIKLNREFALTYNLGTESQINNYAYQFKQLLENNIRTKQRIEDYTELIGISRVLLNQVSKKQFNQTASQLIKQRLLFEIKEILIYSKLSINEIAYELNFSEPNHLNRFFKAMTGLTPITFRQNYQNGII